VARPYLLDMVPNQRISHFLSQRHNKLLFFISDLMDYFLAGLDQQHTYQPNGLADSQPLILKSCNLISLKLVLRMSSFSRNKKLTITIVLFQSLWIFF